MRDEAYLAWVRQQPSCISGQPDCQAHHMIGNGRFGTRKASDYLAMPLTPLEHAELHRLGWREWEAQHGTQWQYVARTLVRAVLAGFFSVKTQPDFLQSLYQSPPTGIRAPQKPRMKAKIGGGRVKRESSTATPAKCVPRRVA